MGIEKLLLHSRNGKKIPENEKQEMLINEEEKLIYCMLNVNEIHIARESERV